MPYISQINGADISASNATNAINATTSSYVDLGINTTVPQFLQLDGDSNPFLQGRRLHISGTISTYIYGGNNTIQLDSGGTTFSGTVTLPVATYQITASQAVTASRAVSSSYVTGSIFSGNNSALSASYALTASHALSGGGGSGVTINNNLNDYIVTATGTANTLNGEANLTFNGSTLVVAGNLRANSITGSLSLTGSLTGSLLGTASWATNALTASFTTRTITSSFPINVTGSSLYSTSPASGVPTNTSGEPLSNNIWLGLEAGAGNGKSNNIFLGVKAGSGSSAFPSTFIGTQAGANTSANQSVFIGEEAGTFATNASNVVFLGYTVGKFATNAFNSNFIGVSAGGNAINADHSQFIGNSTGLNAISASYSIFIGNGAGQTSFTASSVGSNNIIIGNNITLDSQRKDSINIGGIIFGTGSYHITSGFPFSGSANGRIGINVPNPEYALDVSGPVSSTGVIAEFSSDILIATRSSAPSTGVEGQIVPVNNAGTFLLYVYIGGRWRSSSLA